MRTKSFFLKLTAVVLVVVYLCFMPQYLKEALKTRTYDDKFAKPDEDYTGVITLWHVVGFKPYTGSLSAVLGTLAKRVESRHHGIFFEISAMDEAEYEKRIARGERPDVISFPLGLCYPDQLSVLEPTSIGDAALSPALLTSGQWDGKTYAFPYAMSAHAVLWNANVFQERGVQLLEEEWSETWLSALINAFESAQPARNMKKIDTISGDKVIAALLGYTGEVAAYDEFRSGKTAIAVADLRAAGDLLALQMAGKGFTFDAMVIPGGTSLVQMIGIHKDAEWEKLPYANELVETFLSETAAKQFWRLGLLPACGIPEGEKTDNALLREAAEKLVDPLIPNAFLAQRYKDILPEIAERALAGDGEAKRDLEERVKELVT